MLYIARRYAPLWTPFLGGCPPPPPAWERIISRSLPKREKALTSSY
ncbi:MAG: hypothetical protein LBD58_11625 [Treponema sp.]|nr:hypothetical protein [Treponema sp.]